MSRPLKITLPAVGLYSWRMARPAVLLPQPDSPTSPSVSPFLIVEIKTVHGPHRPHLPRKKTPLVIGKVHHAALPP